MRQCLLNHNKLDNAKLLTIEKCMPNIKVLADIECISSKLHMSQKGLINLQQINEKYYIKSILFHACGIC